MSESKPREYFLADSHLKTETGQEFRIAGTFPESGMLTGSYIHVIEHSAFVRLQEELEYPKRLLADERSGDCDKDKTIRRLERNLNNALSENERISQFSREEGARLFDAQKENAVLREAVEFYADYGSWQHHPDWTGEYTVMNESDCYRMSGDDGRIIAGEKAREALEKVKSEKAEAE